MFIGLTLFMFIPSLRIFFKYIAEFSVFVSILYFLFLSILFYCIIFENNRLIYDTINNKIFIALTLLTIYIIVWNIYPIADGLKVQMRGSDQDDCVILGVEHLLNFENPYLSKSFYGNSCSPGIGMLIAHLPFVFFDIYVLGAPTFVSISTYFIYKYYNDLFLASSFLIFNLSCLLLLELMVVGSDLIFIGVGIVFLSLLLIKAIDLKSMKFIILVALLCGIIASTRVNFLVLIFLSSSYIFLHWQRGAWVFFIFSATLALIPSLIIYISNPEIFTPLHLVGKSSQLMSPMLKYSAIFISGLLFLWSLYLVKKDIKNINIALFVTLLPSLLSLSIGDLFMRSGEIALWEGANYLIPLIPLSALLLIEIRKKNYHQIIKSSGSGKYFKHHCQ